MTVSLHHPLPVVLGALDRLALNEPARLLAQDLARVCESEGVVASPEALALAAQQQLEASQPKAEGSAAAMIRPRWNRPTSGEMWTQWKARVHRSLCRAKWVGWPSGLVFLVTEGMGIARAIPEGSTWAFMGIVVSSFVVGLTCLITAEGKAITRSRLSEHVPSEEDWARWNGSALAQAYLRAHVSKELPLMKGDLPWLNELADDEKHAQNVMAAQALVLATG